MVFNHFGLLTTIVLLFIGDYRYLPIILLYIKLFYITLHYVMLYYIKGGFGGFF